MKRKKTGKKDQPVIVSVENGRWILSRYRRVFVPALAVVIVALAAFVPVAVYRSIAGTATANLQPEGGTKVGVTVGSDSNASGGQFIQFGAGGGYDLVVTSASASPAAPTAGQQVTFSAVIKNQGAGALPSGTILGTSFQVDGTKMNWSDTHTTGLAPGQSVTLTANSGPAAVAYWSATSGTHTIEAYVDDINRFPNETNESNNKLTFSLNVTGTTPPPGNCSGQGNAKVGNTRGGLLGMANGTGYPSSSTDRDKYMNVFSDMGIKWYRMNMEFWNMNEYKDVITRAKARGICILGNISGNHQGGAQWDAPSNLDQWATDAANEVDALKADVHVWEIWNEQNIGFWNPGPDPAKYADLLHRTYLKIKEKDPTAIVLGGGLAPHGDGKNTADKGYSVYYWQEVYKWNKSKGRQGSEQLFDGLAHHPYYYPGSAAGSVANKTLGSGFYQTFLIHQVMCDANYGGPSGDCNKKIWGTEGGYPTECPSNISEADRCVSEATAQSYYPPLLDIWMNDWGSFTGPYMKHETQNNPAARVQDTHEGYMGMVRADFSRKPEFDTWKAYAGRTN